MYNDDRRFTGRTEFSVEDRDVAGLELGPWSDMLTSRTSHTRRRFLLGATRNPLQLDISRARQKSMLRICPRPRERTGRSPTAFVLKLAPQQFPCR